MFGLSFAQWSLSVVRQRDHMVMGSRNPEWRERERETDRWRREYWTELSVGVITKRKRGKCIDVGCR